MPPLFPLTQPHPYPLTPLSHPSLNPLPIPPSPPSLLTSYPPSPPFLPQPILSPLPTSHHSSSIPISLPTGASHATQHPTQLLHTPITPSNPLRLLYYTCCILLPTPSTHLLPLHTYPYVQHQLPPSSPTSTPFPATTTPSADSQRLAQLEQLPHSITDNQQREKEARRGLELEVQQLRAQASIQLLDALAEQRRAEAAQAELRRQEDQAQFDAKLSTAISMSAHATQTISQQVSNLTQLITGLPLPAPPPPPPPVHEPTDNTLPNLISTA